MGETTVQRIRKRKSYSMWADMFMELAGSDYSDTRIIRIMLRFYRRMEEAAIFGSRQMSNWVLESLNQVIVDKTHTSVEEVERLAKEVIEGKT